MFFHGIDYKYLLFQFPVLSPRQSIKRLNKMQTRDRNHLICKFGFEPVHFLESSKNFTTEQCIASCFSFGNVIIVYHTLSLPLLQLSANEVGTPVASMKKADFLIVRDKKLMCQLQKSFSDRPIFVPKQFAFIDKIKRLKKIRGKMRNVSN